ncbi:MAG: GNAT family N-acetyltransferase [Nocardioides sp.]
MDVQSLGFRTDLALLQYGGTLVEDGGTHLVVRTPRLPTFFWGNFLLLGAPPPADQIDHWVDVFRAEFPDASHVAFGIDRPSDGDLAPLCDAGLTVDSDITLTTTSVRPPRRSATEVGAGEVRPLEGNADWDQQVELSMAGDIDPHVTREFSTGRDRAYRGLIEAGHGRWWGAFLGGRLVASLGIVEAGAGLARFQHVKTHPDHRNRGLAGTLIHRAGRDALENLGAERLVMVADPDYLAIRLYRSLGFVDAEPQVGASLLPPP